MNVHLPSVSTPNRPSAAESSRRCKRLLALAHLVLGQRLDARGAAHEDDAGRRQQGGERGVDDEQQPLRLARRLAELRREPALELRQAVVEVRAPGRASPTPTAASTSPRRTRSRECSASSRICWMTTSASVHVTIASAMNGNVVEPAEQADQAADVVGMVAALQEAVARHRQVGVGPSAAPRARCDRRAGPPAPAGSAGSRLPCGTGRSRADRSARPSGPSE